MNHQKSQAKSLVIWCFLDGKAGHESQSQGLIEALERRVSSVNVHRLSAGQVPHAFFQWLLGGFEQGRDLPKPDLILGAGHRTHWAMLAARRAFGGRIVVLMRPSLPLRWFDCVVAPEHDRPKAASDVIVTKGVLNPIRPAERASTEKGLILIGGPSKHHGWDDQSILQQVLTILEQSPKVDWELTTSRRTPEPTVQMLQAIQRDELRVVPFESTEPGWVSAHLQSCARVWVSEDSVSMVFESLTAGARVGLLRVPAMRRTSRVQRAVGQLKEEGWVVEVGQEVDSKSERPPLAEADRVASKLMDRYNL